MVNLSLPSWVKSLLFLLGGPGTLQGGGRSTSHSNTFLHFPPVNTGGVEISDSAKDLSQNFLSTGLRC